MQDYRLSHLSTKSDLLRTVREQPPAWHSQRQTRRFPRVNISAPRLRLRHMWYYTCAGLDGMSQGLWTSLFNGASTCTDQPGHQWPTLQHTRRLTLLWRLVPRTLLSHPKYSPVDKLGGTSSCLVPQLLSVSPSTKTKVPPFRKKL